MGLTQTDCSEHLNEGGDAEEARARAARGPAHAQRRAQHTQEKIRSSAAKPRRPDRAVYVPRALRSADNNVPEESKPPDTRKRLGQSTETNAKCPKSPTIQVRDRSQPGTPRRSIDKNFCNVYTPPHLRNQRSHTTPSICQANEAITTESVPSGVCSQVPNNDSAISFSDNSLIDTNVGENFYIGDYFANGPLGFYSPTVYDDYESIGSADEGRFSEGNKPIAIEGYSVIASDILEQENDWRTNETNDINMALQDANRSAIITDVYPLGYNNSKDEDVEQNELRRASQEINRSSKRIIKQSFDSDVLVISDPVEETRKPEPLPPVVEKKEVPARTKPKLEPKLSLKREENDWDAVFDDSGECLDPTLLEELTATVGKVHISKAKNNYEQYQTKGQTLFNGPYDETFGHVVEVYDFPNEFKTNDLLSVFSEYKDTGFEIKWVDDTHALICFSSSKIAAEVLSCQRPLVRCRPLHAATLESRNKAKKCAEFLQPYRQRPETCAALARRLVTGALGVRLSTARQERAEERRLITLAREKKRQAALHKEAAWDGSLTSEPINDT